MSVKCEECESEFNQRKNMYAHVRKFHNREPIALKKNPVIKLVKCDECATYFSNKTNMYAHVRKFHNKEPIALEKNPVVKVVKCDECATDFSNKKNMYAHVRKFHNKEPIALKKKPLVKVVKCDECATDFSNKNNMYAHVRKFHNKEPIPSKKTPEFECSVCNKYFFFKSSLRNHEINEHEIEIDHDYTRSSRKTSRLLCPQESCNKTFVYYKSLLKHLNTHNIDVEMEDYEFSSLESFLQWKDNVQQKEMSFYTRDSAPKKLSTVEAWNLFYNCHRSYSYVKKGKNIRSLKSMGSHKIGKACPSRMKVTMMGNLNQPYSIKVKYWKTHFGHELQLGHVSLDSKTRSKIAGKLKEGVSFNHILDVIRDTAVNKQNINQRLSILERKDLHNIVRDFNIDYCTKRHQNDAVSVKTWVSEMQESEDNPVLYYKGQDDEDKNTSLDNLCLACPVHACAMEYFENSCSNINPQNFEETDEVSRLLDLSQNAVPKISENESLKRKYDLINGLLDKVGDIPTEYFHKLERYADISISMLNKQDSVKLNTTENINVQQKIEKQCRFYSTKAKRKKTNIEISKPSRFEEIAIKVGLNNSTEILNIHSGNDHTYQ